MKKQLLFLLMTLLPMFSFADEAEINGFWYNLVSKAKQAEVIQYKDTKYSGDIEIPSTVEYGGATYNVTSIGDSSFFGCFGLTSITIPGSVTNIGTSAFYNCSGLTSVTIGNSVTSIGAAAFYNCRSLTTVTIPNSVTSIGGAAFSGCSGLTSIQIPNSVTSIGDEAFYNCSGLTSVTIGNSVTSIGNSAFYNCRSLTTVTIPNSVTSIGKSTFFNCSGLTSVTIGNSVTSISYEAFRSCSGLTSVTIGNSVTSIDDEAFYECSGLTSVTIPGSVTSIGNRAFYGCSGLTSITIPGSVTSIGNRAFYGCGGLTSIEVETGNTTYDSRNNCNAIIETATNRLIVGCQNTIILNSVTSIGDNAFSYCSGLTSITIPGSVTSIGDGAFWGCSSLTSVTIGSGVMRIGKYAFAYCQELTDAYCYAENVPSTSSDAFWNSYIEYATLHVPAESIEQYKATEPWSLFGTILSLDGDEPEPPVLKKCATPTISYSNGELAFNCETEGVDYVSEITDSDIKKNYTAKIKLSVTYNLTVYATKTEYENSDTIHATLCWIDAEPKTEGIEEDAVTEVKALPVLIQSHDGTISVQGLDAGTLVTIYSTDGKQQGSNVVVNGATTIRTSLQPGSIAVVKIGERSIKVLIK